MLEKVYIYLKSSINNSRDNMFELLIIIVCLLINAILAGTETAFIATSKAALKAQAKNGDEKAALFLTLRENPERTLSVLQIGITFLGAFAAAVGGAGAEESLTPYIKNLFGVKESIAELISIFIVVVPLTYASVVFGELVPKTLALRRANFFGTLSAPWLHWSSRLINPIVTVLEWSTKKIIQLFPKHHTQSEENEEGLELQGLSSHNKQYIMNMVKIEKTMVKAIFVPWQEVVYLKTVMSIEEVEKLIIASGHTRLPIVDEDKVIGILNSKEFFAFQKTKKKDWLNLKRSVIYLHEETYLLAALRFLQEKRAHMAIVRNNITKTGIITMEAIFEEIIGDIYDEDDDGVLKKLLS